MVGAYYYMLVDEGINLSVGGWIHGWMYIFKNKLRGKY